MNASILALVLAVLTGPMVETAKEPGTHLYVRTIPPGAKIILDERPGTTDGLLSVTPGKHRVVVELDGYAPERREVDVPQGRITRVELSLKPTNDSYDGRSMAEWKRLALNDVSAETRAKAMDALEALGNRGRADEAVAAIKSALAQEQDSAVVKAAYIALVRLGPPAVPTLVDGFKSQQPQTRRMVVKALQSYRVPKDPDRSVVPEQVASALIVATRDPDPAVRGEACYTLGFRVFRGPGDEHSDKIVSSLTMALGDEEQIAGISGYAPSSVQNEACRALAMYGAKAEAAVPSLIEIIQRTPKPGQDLEKNRNVTKTNEVAIQALGRIGPAAKAALPVLESLQKNKYVLYSTTPEAIERIQGTYRGPGVAARTKQRTGAASRGQAATDGNPFEATGAKPPKASTPAQAAIDANPFAPTGAKPPTAVAAAKQPGAKGPAADATGSKPQPAQPAAKAASVSAAPLAEQEQADKVEDLVEKALLETDAEFDFDAMPLTDVVEILRGRMKTNILLDGNALDDSSIDPSTTQVTIRMRVSRGSAIDFMLSQLGLTWTVRDGAMVITTARKAQEELSTKVYPIEDLAVRGDHNSLIDIITSTIAPQTWDKAGGPGSIMVVGVPRSARLVIRQTYQVHRHVRRLLATLRTMHADAESGKTSEPVLFYGALTASPADVQSLRKTLAQPVSGFDFDQLPLTDVVDILRNVHKATIVLDAKALEDKNIDPSTTNVNFRVQGIPLGQALALLLEQLGLTWTLDGDYLRITTKEFGEGRLVVGVYPVGDLAESREGPYAGSTVRNPSGLIATITSAIAPKTWVAGRGSIQPVDFGKFNGLVVLQTDAIHRQIAALLAQLRAKGEPPAGKPAVEKAGTSKY